jgi:Kef-type K+ transport system membrane component KefB
MFVIGMELDIKKPKQSETVVISHASIVIPLRWVLVCLILCLTDLRRGVQFLSLVCLWGCHEHNSFPVLARIVQERKFIKRSAIVITCAAADDITAWCLLA